MASDWIWLLWQLVLRTERYCKERNIDNPLHSQTDCQTRKQLNGHWDTAGILMYLGVEKWNCAFQLSMALFYDSGKSTEAIECPKPVKGPPTSTLKCVWVLVAPQQLWRCWDILLIPLPTSAATYSCLRQTLETTDLQSKLREADFLNQIKGEKYIWKLSTKFTMLKYSGCQHCTIYS